LKHFRSILLTSVVLFFFVFFGKNVQGQAPVTDTQFWPDVQISKDLDKEKKWSGTLLVQGRFGNGLRTTTDARVGLTLTRKLNKHFRVGGTYIYRYANATFTSGSYSNRLMGFLQASTALPGKFEVSGRTMLSRDMRNSRPDETVWRNLIRLRRKVAIGDSWIEPYVSYEHFYNITHTRHQRHREMLGAVRPLSKRLDLDVYFLRQDAATSSRPRNLNVFGTSLKIKL
jgi:hypothetical protein